MKRFRMKQPFYIILILALGSACGVFAAVYHIVQLVNTPPLNAFRMILFILLIVLALFLLVLCAGVLVYPYYVVKNGKLYSVMGILHTSYPIENISELTYFKAQGKLVMYMTNDKFLVIMLSESKHEDFMKALREINPQIVYDNKINEND